MGIKKKKLKNGMMGLCWNNDLPDKKKVIIPYAFIKRSFNNMRK